MLFNQLSSVLICYFWVDEGKIMKKSWRVAKTAKKSSSRISAKRSLIVMPNPIAWG
jgi:hypothetical protein